MKELIGWGSAVVGMPTFGVQTYRQWNNRHEPVDVLSLWFFALSVLGTSGQLAYSWMVENWVFLTVNCCLVVNNAIGLGIALYRLRAAEPAKSDAG